MVWAGVAYSGLRTALVFIDDGKKINQNVYLVMLKDKVIPWMKSLTINNGLTLQQTCATAHQANIVQAWCQRNFTAFWSNKMWPSSSPDLNLIDLKIWSILEQKACTVSHPSSEVLKKTINRIMGPNCKRNCACNLCSSYSMFSSCNSGQGWICSIICYTRRRVYIFLCVSLI